MTHGTTQVQQIRHLDIKNLAALVADQEFVGRTRSSAFLMAAQQTSRRRDEAPSGYLEYVKGRNPTKLQSQVCSLTDIDLLSLWPLYI